MGPSIRYRKSVHEKEVVVQKATEVLTEIHEGWTPDIVVGIDFGTQSSCVAVFKNEAVDVVANENGTFV